MQFRVAMSRVRPGPDRTIIIEHGVREIEADTQEDAREKAAEGNDGVEWTESANKGFLVGEGAAFVSSIAAIGPKGSASQAQRDITNQGFRVGGGSPIKREPGALPVKPEPEAPSPPNDPSAPNNGIDGAQKRQPQVDGQQQTDQQQQGQQQSGTEDTRTQEQKDADEKAEQERQQEQRDAAAAKEAERLKNEAADRDRQANDKKSPKAS